MLCPSCSSILEEGATECPSCGIILARWRPRTPSPPAATRPLDLDDPPEPSRARRTWLLLLGGLLLLGAAWVWLEIRERKTTLVGLIRDRPRAVEKEPGGAPPFDSSWKLPGSPMGAATNGTELIVGNRIDPWGVIRLTSDGLDGFRTEKLRVIEPRNQQNISLNSLTWNGSTWVGVALSSWFERREGMSFTVHHPTTLAVTRHLPAPDRTGCVAWDGSHYWAATRRNTRDSSEPNVLYKLDRDFRIVSESEPPGPGCQGLAWDGRRLWYVDVFSDDISTIDIVDGEPGAVSRRESGLSYLSGIVSYRNDIWVTEYDGNRIHRLGRPVRLAWGAAGPPADGAAAARPAPASDAAIDALRALLRSENFADRQRAEIELERLGAPIDFDRTVNTFFEERPADTDVIDWQAEIRAGAVVARWKFWFGPDLFQRGEADSTLITVPQFARYTLTVTSPDGTRTEKQFDAVPGVNFMADVPLTLATDPGAYQIDLFMHVQYVNPEGEAKILNNSKLGLRLRK